MKHSITYLAILFVLLNSTIAAQTFPCDGSLLFSINQGSAPNNTYKVIFGPFGTKAFALLKTFQGGQFNALGFNPQDNYIYGVQENSNEVVRLKSDGSFDAIGTVSEVSNLQATAGDCAPTGEYLVLENELNQILVYTVVDNFELVNRIDLYWDPESGYEGTFIPMLGDIAIDPINPSFAYGFQGNYIHPDLQPAATRGMLFRINLDFASPDLGMVTPIDKVSDLEIRKMESLFFTSSGTLFGYGSINNSTLVENKFISINKNTAETNIFTESGPSADASDGCSCPYTLSFECLANPAEVLCTDDELTYSLRVTNRFFQELPNVNITDTIPAGMIIKSIPADYLSYVTPGTGVGTRFLDLTGINIPARGMLQIDFTVDINDIPIDLVGNQAFLKNLPARFGGFLPSDNPGTPNEIGDCTNIFGIAQTLNQFSIEVSQPSDCLNANDGTARVSSPVFIAGEEYDVNLRNENWDLYNWEVSIDNQNSFYLENLTPGRYTMYSMAPKISQCSFAMRDTSIDIIAPNEQLQVAEQTNAPICEYSTLELSVDVSPSGEVKWKGPGFHTEGANVQMDSALAQWSGTYTMLATYGACEQERMLEVEVTEDIEARIIGDEEYCVRDSMILRAEGEGELESFLWEGPLGIAGSEQEFIIPSMTENNEGLYQVFINNGACQDTAFIEIDMLPSPTISLPAFIETDLCETIRLRPLITGDNNVSYAWSPADALSCADCLEPDLELPIQSSYELQVVNDYLCTDSAKVNVQLDRSKLIYIPNAISPNADGNNDYFQIFPGCPVQSIVKMEIFSRWGAQIYSAGSQDFSNHINFWDGRIAGKNITPGVYIYRVELALKDGTTAIMTGDVSVMK